MARRYRKVYPRFWTDEKVRELSVTDKLVALYLLTSGQTNRIGLYLLSEGLASEELGIPLGTLRKRIAYVCDRLNWQRDSASKLLYIPTWWRYNPPENPKVLIGNLTDIAELPESPLVTAFKENTTYLPHTFADTFVRTLGHTSAITGTGTGTGIDNPPLPPFEKGGNGKSAGTKRAERAAERQRQLEETAARAKRRDEGGGA